MKFVKYQRFWWLYDEDTPLNNATIFHNWKYIKLDNIDITDFEIVEAVSRRKLNWYGTDVYDDTLKAGWLDRNGKFYGCKWAYHYLQAHYVHKKSDETLESLGWIHISKADENDTGKYVAEFLGDYKEGIMPTDSQMAYLQTRNDVDFDKVSYAYINGNRSKAARYEADLKNKELIKVKNEEIKL